ncbi:hypothetical protein HYPSUDRAFT_73490 [Hypholoma sublateritium FD-334 SS-4]|uniref:DUF302 domain-containing protein n=1 Tax=Hypholoma sublateritium (strain FD-334 SS-4) TaxID=945553 RepID=A0A0D2PGN5_HYPSF|nr:hypothetical protein HYPSUDRAFT_73490 [Hypholoma sublateritium FD-334 SS-4]
MASSTTISEHTIKIVEVETGVPFKEVIARLDDEVNKAGSAGVVDALRGAATEEEFVAVIERTVKPGADFLFFGALPLHSVLRFGVDSSGGGILVYTIGNPLIARGIIRANARAAYSIPPRLLVLEVNGGAGARVHYHLPSSVMGGGEGVPGLDAQLLALDEKVARLVGRITERRPAGAAL